MRSESASRRAFFSSSVSRSLVRCLMKRMTSSLLVEVEVVVGVERRESAVVRARLPMILPSERLRLALQIEIYWSISPSLRRLRSVITKFYYFYTKHIR